MPIDIGTALVGVGQHWSKALQDQEAVKMEKEKLAFDQMMARDRAGRDQGMLDLQRDQEARIAAKQLFDQTLAFAKSAPSQPLNEEQYSKLDQTVAPGFFRESAVPQGAVRDLEGNAQAGEVLPGFGQAGQKRYDYVPGETERMQIAALQEQGRAGRMEDNQTFQRELTGLRQDFGREMQNLRGDQALNRVMVQPIVIKTQDDEGNPVTKVTTKGGALKEGEFKGAPTAEQVNKGKAREQAGKIFDTIDRLSQRINTSEGLLAKMQGGTQKVQAMANYNDDVAGYEAMISGFTPLIARAVGHVGVLTEQDVQSVRALFPKPGDSKSLRDRKIEQVKYLMGGGVILGGNDPNEDFTSVLRRANIAPAAEQIAPGGGGAQPGAPPTRRRELYDPATGKFTQVP